KEGNGYVGEVRGWNFLGNAEGEEVRYDNLEVTRLIHIYEPKYLSVLPSTSLSAAVKKEVIRYLKLVREYASKLQSARNGNLNYSRLVEEVDKIVAEIGKDTSALTREDCKRFKTKDDGAQMAIKIAERGNKEEGSFSAFYE